MTPEVKQRIEQIRQGIVPEGYKKTKAGIIPTDWDVKSVGAHIKEYKQLSNNIKDIPVYTSSRKGLFPQFEYYIDKEAVKTNLGYKVVPNGYATYRHMSDDDVFHFNINMTGGEILVSSEYPVFCASQDAELGFLIPMLNGTARFRYFCRTQKLGGTRTRLYLENLKKYLIPTPSLKEQKEIARILSLQDKVIELNQHKIEEIKKMKKFFLSKMFPKKGQIVPEIRFAGFTDAWEQRKLGSIVSITTGRLDANAATSDGIYAFFTCGKETLRTDSFAFDGNAILISGNGDLGYTRKYSGKFNAYQRTYVLQGFSEHFEFIEHAIHRYLPDKIKSESFGGAMPYIKLDTLADLLVYVPSLLESSAVADYLTNLDHLITLHQRKLEEEKQKKKALMQLLLTGIARVQA